MFKVFLCLGAVLGFSTRSVSIEDEFRTSVKNTRFIAQYEESPTLDLAILNVLIYGQKPSSVMAETILRHNLKAALALYKDKNIFATAWHVQGDDESAIPLADGSSHLIYVAKEKIIKTWKEYEGIKTDVSTNKQEGYFVEYEERDILVPPRGRKFATINVVFQKGSRWGSRSSSRGKAYSILVAELKKAVAKQETKWSTTAYAYVGKREDTADRRQIRDRERQDGGYIIVEYDPTNGKITGGDGKDL